MTLLRLLLVSALALTACGPKPSPRQRYVDAINLKAEGDSRAAFDALLALAHEEPDSRAGRRARAILTGGSVLTDLAILATLASVAMPNFEGFQGQSKRAEARVALRELAKTQHAYHGAHERFCVTFEECGWDPPRRSTYLFFLSRREVAGGTGAEEAGLLRMQADVTLSAMNLAPKVTPSSFLMMAVGDPDGDGEVDVWSIDEDDNLVNLIKDE